MSLRIAHINKKKIKEQPESRVLEIMNRFLINQETLAQKRRLKSKLNNQKP